MRVIISNDKQRLYAKIDYGLLEKTKLNSAATSSATTINVINPSGFSDNDYILIGDWFSDTSEIKQINCICGKNITLKNSTSFSHDNKSNIYRLEYNQIRFYENDTLLDTVDIKPDYYTSYAYSITDENKQYSIAFYNSTTTNSSTRGEKIYGYEHLLCTSGDVFSFEDLDITGHKLLDKMDIATNEIITQYIVQDQNYDDMSYRDYYRIPSALLSLHYVFAELTKNPDDIAAEKKKYYRDLYEVKAREASEKITKKDKDIKIFSQTRAMR